MSDSMKQKRAANSTPQGESLEDWLNSLPAEGTFRMIGPGQEGYEEAKMALEAERMGVPEAPDAIM